jgi:signal transduction histidine kinase
MAVSLPGATPPGPVSGDNDLVSVVSDRWGGWAVAGRRAAAARYCPALAAGCLGVFAAAEILIRALNAPSAGEPGGGWWLATVSAVLVGLATTVPVSLAWTQPVAAAVSVCAAGLLSLGLFQTLTVAGLVAQLAVLYRLGLRGAQVLAACLAAPFVLLALTPAAGGETRALSVLLAALAPAAAWAGATQRARAQARAHGAVQEQAEGSWRQHTVRGERARISRELHDVVAHHISMIVVQAEAARLTTPGMPGQGAQKLSEISDTARAALTEMRRLLGVLREDITPGPAGTAARRPQPGLQQLNELIDAARDTSGAGIRLIISGGVETLDPGVELAAYRIVQEALTNARRHAPGAAVDVELHYAADALRLRVRDNGPGPPPEPLTGGHGLLGMRERTTAAGGELRTGPGVGGGFCVEATLPGKAAA